jgi:predicted metal-binding membrane protein
MVTVTAHPRATLLVPAMAGLVATIWAALIVWEQGPYGRYLEHGSWTDAGLAAGLCRAVPGGSWLVPGALYAVGWMLMTAAMMLPSTLPLLRRFERLAAARNGRAKLMLLLIGGYLVAWLAFGIAAHVLDALLHAAAGRSAWLALNGWAVGAVVLGGAGLFQFSRLKRLCLDRCRAPLGFILRRWHGRTPYRDAFAIGLDHGVFCVGCCWALMMLMFIVGTGNVGWMLALGALMAIEKNAPGMRWLSGTVGFALLALAAIVAAENI